ncbi:hypothetical protein ACFQNE_03215 [Gordonia phosphorivorans]|uniref:SGNH hydrolase-type esterase domain-containing protein n=1 Tax=Gordonia phosphorivorans TaxID=1056982 RepID=A0ABV6H3V5_9ACTN
MPPSPRGVTVGAAMLASAALLAGSAATVHAEPTTDLAGSFADFADQLPGTIEVAVTAAGSADTVVFTTPDKPSPAAAPPSAPPPTAKPSAPAGKTRCTSLAHIGDSTSTMIDQADYLPNPADRAGAQYKRVGVDKFVLDATGGRSIMETVSGNPNAATGVDTLIQQGFKGCWVIVMGVNDAANIAVGSQVGEQARIDAIMSRLGGQDVMWATSATSNPSNSAYASANMTKFNKVLQAAASKYPNLKVFDWAAHATPAMFSDGIHYTSQAAATRNKMFADAVADLFPAEALTPAPGPAPAPEAPVLAGERSALPAWGTIRVPVALAAARAGADSADVTAALAGSDSAAVNRLWQQLGSSPGQAVEKALGELGDRTTRVRAGSGDDYAVLAKTVWPAGSQSMFGAGLLCAADRGAVTKPMTPPTSGQGLWGLQTAVGQNGVQFVAAHGGWGPVESSSTARQLGLIQTARGLLSVSIAATADGADHDKSVSLVTKAADWVTANVAALPAGFCPGTEPTT